MLDGGAPEHVVGPTSTRATIQRRLGRLWYKEIACFTGDQGSSY